VRPARDSRYPCTLAGFRGSRQGPAYPTRVPSCCPRDSCRLAARPSRKASLQFQILTFPPVGKRTRSRVSPHRLSCSPASTTHVLRPAYLRKPGRFHCSGRFTRPRLTAFKCTYSTVSPLSFTVRSGWHRAQRIVPEPSEGKRPCHNSLVSLRRRYAGPEGRNIVAHHPQVHFLGGRAASDTQ
jgi:hypothetical protein